MKERLVSGVGSLSGAASVLGSWQVCHNLCLAAIAALSVVGITVTGMPFLFFTEIAVYVWSLAVVLLGVTTYLYMTKGCISRSLITINAGLIVVGIPFWESLTAVFWILGGLVVVGGAALYLHDRREKECCNG